MKKISKQIPVEKLRELALHFLNGASTVKMDLVGLEELENLSDDPVVGCYNRGDKYIYSDPTKAFETYLKEDQELSGSVSDDIVIASRQYLAAIEVLEMLFKDGTIVLRKP